jgi:hypothetical protein
VIATSFDLKFLSRERFVMFKKLCCALLVSSFAISAIAVEPAGGDPGVAALDKAFWIWSDDAKGTQTLGVKTGTKRKIRKVLTLPQKPEVTSATLIVGARNSANIRANGNLVGDVEGSLPQSFDLLPHVDRGDNELLFQVENKGKGKGNSPAGLLGAIYLEFDDQSTSVVVTDKTWQTGSSSLFPDWTPARELEPRKK